MKKLTDMIFESEVAEDIIGDTQFVQTAFSEVIQSVYPSLLNHTAIDFRNLKMGSGDYWSDVYTDLTNHLPFGNLFGQYSEMKLFARFMSTDSSVQPELSHDVYAHFFLVGRDGGGSQFTTPLGKAMINVEPPNQFMSFVWIDVEGKSTRFGI